MNEIEQVANRDARTENTKRTGDLCFAPLENGVATATEIAANIPTPVAVAVDR